MPLGLFLCLRQHGFGLWQPERHLHGAVHVDCRGQRCACLLQPSHLAVQRAESKVAVGCEWTHAECVGQREGLPVVAFSLRALRGSTLRRNLAEEP